MTCTVDTMDRQGDLKGRRKATEAGASATSDGQNHAYMRTVMLPTSLFTTDTTCNDFASVETLGQGTFGRAVLCVHKETSKPVVVKAVRKNGLIGQKQLATELLALAHSAGCRFVVRLHGAFQDYHHAYFILEYAPGGELYDYIDATHGGFCLTNARFYAAEVLSALYYLHYVARPAIVYRDLKPENVMIGADGHIRLVDFGAAKFLDRDDRAYTMCGTSSYIPPEMIRKAGYDHRADMWAFGNFVYELLTGAPPFAADNTVTLFVQVLKSHVTIPSYVDPQAHHLIRGLLTKDPSRRFTSQSARSHPFFASLSWDDVDNSRLSPPFVPRLDGPLDTKYFEHELREEKTAIFRFEEAAESSC